MEEFEMFSEYIDYNMDISAMKKLIEKYSDQLKQMRKNNERLSKIMKKLREKLEEMEQETKEIFLIKSKNYGAKQRDIQQRE